jgi:aminoglycoside phosphotransferase (APT) family kinase protein
MKEQWTDEAASVRTDEGLDAKKIGAFLKDKIPGLDGDMVIRQFPSGYSNLTYLITGQGWELVLRRPPFGKKAKTAHDMGREYRMLTALKPVFPYCPTPLAYTEDESIIGSPFYVMERIRGIILRKELPKGMTISPFDMAALCDELLRIHAELHAVDYRKIGLEDFGRPDGYAERQVAGWSSRFREAKTPDAPDFETVMSWLKESIPPVSAPPSLIHNDYKFDNVVLDPDNPLKIIGVLDWEMATIGDPLMDLGSSLAYWVEKGDPETMEMIRTLPSNIDGALTRKELVARYAERSGLNVDRFDFYYCFGLFRLAVIAQQIYYRFYHGQTKDDRFGILVVAVKILEKLALKVIDKPGSW